MPKVSKVISGGQDGADLAGLIAAKDLGIPTGGWMPLGWRTKSGSHPEYANYYNLQQHLKPTYPPRTRQNVNDSDGTVRFAHSFHTPGERCTITAILALQKPYHDVEVIKTNHDVGFKIEHWEHRLLNFQRWLATNNIETLNVAGNAAVGMMPVVIKFLTEALR